MLCFFLWRGGGPPLQSACTVQRYVRPPGKKLEPKTITRLMSWDLHDIDLDLSSDVITFDPKT